MDRIKFFYTNLFKTGTITVTSEHVNFPKENMQHRDFNKMWRSNHGAGSGWGLFYIDATVNDRLDFEDSGAVVRTALLTPGAYNADTLASHIETQMEAVTTDLFTVEYIESGAGTNKFRITNDTGIFELLWNSGANKARSIAGAIGYDDSADGTGESVYLADYIRIHALEYIRKDLDSAHNIYGAIIRGHNFQAGAAVYVQFSDDNWTTVAEQQIFTIQDDILVCEWDTPKNYRYVGIMIYDTSNPDGYVAMGVVSMSDQFQPTENFLHEGEIQRVDPSIIMESESGQESTLQQESFDTWTYTFRVKGSTQKGYFDTMFNTVGTSKALFVCEDPSIPLTTTKYVRFTGWKWTPIRRDINLWYLSIGVKEQR